MAPMVARLVKVKKVRDGMQNRFSMENRFSAPPPPTPTPTPTHTPTDIFPVFPGCNSCDRDWHKGRYAVFFLSFLFQFNYYNRSHSGFGSSACPRQEEGSGEKGHSHHPPPEYLCSKETHKYVGIPKTTVAKGYHGPQLLNTTAPLN